MKDLLAGKTNTYIFHMSWTTNKVNKLKYFQQIGQWYVQDTCPGKTVQEIDTTITTIGDKTKGSLLNKCCIATPVTVSYKNLLAHDTKTKLICRLLL